MDAAANRAIQLFGTQGTTSCDQLLHPGGKRRSIERLPVQGRQLQMDVRIGKGRQGMNPVAWPLDALDRHDGACVNSQQDPVTNSSIDPGTVQTKVLHFCRYR